MTRRPTMRDIARLAGVSQTTVSFVLNKNPNISIQDSTRKSVFDAATELGYTQPKRKRRRSATRTIGFLIDEVANSSLMSDFFEGASEIATQYGCQMPMILTRGSKKVEEDALDAWQNTDLVGVIYGTIVTRAVSPSKRFGDVNTVLLNCYAKGTDFVSILPGETQGGMRATRCLQKAGCRDIIHITGEAWLEAVQKRIAGFKSELVATDDALIFCSTLGIQSGYNNMIKVLAERPCPDGVFCGNDWIALGVYQALYENGKRPGKDVKIVGYDNLFFAENMAPPLTTINLPYHDMGQMAVELLMKAENKALKGPREVKLPCTLIEREST